MTTTMENSTNTITKSLQKRQQALNQFKARKELFLKRKSQIQKEIEEAETIWMDALEQLPDRFFQL